MWETRVPGIKGECTLSSLFNWPPFNRFPLEGSSRVKDHPCARVTDAKGSHDGG